METGEETQHQHRMNGWEALTKIVSDLVFAAVVLGMMGVIYLLCK